MIYGFFFSFSFVRPLLISAIPRRHLLLSTSYVVISFRQHLPSSSSSINICRRHLLPLTSAVVIFHHHHLSSFCRFHVSVQILFLNVTRRLSPLFWEFRKNSLMWCSFARSGLVPSLRGRWAYGCLSSYFSCL